MSTSRRTTLTSGAAVLALALAAAPAAAAMTAAAPASVPPTAAGTCLYMLRDDPGGGTQFWVLRKSGRQLRGTTGAFESEWSETFGTISGSRAVMYVQKPYAPNKYRRITMSWSASQDAFTGYRRVSKAQMRRESGGGVPIQGTPCA